MLGQEPKVIVRFEEHRYLCADVIRQYGEAFETHGGHLIELRRDVQQLNSGIPYQSVNMRERDLTSVSCQIGSNDHREASAE